MENKNFIIALVLSVLVMFLWGEYFAPKPQPEKTQTAHTDESKNKQEPAPSAPDPIPSATPASQIPAKQIKHRFPVTQITMHDDALQVTVSTKRGEAVQLLAIGRRYKKKVELLAGLSKNAYFPAITSLFKEEPVYENKGVHDGTLVLSYTQDGITEQKLFSLLGGYRIKVTRKIFNDTDKPISYTPTLMFHSQYKNEEIFHATRKTFSIVAGNRNGAETLSSSEDVQHYASTHSDTVFAGVDYGYFLFSVIADGTQSLVVSGTVDDDKNRTDLFASYPTHTILPGKQSADSFIVYFGPKEERYLKNAAAGLEKSVKFGWMGFLSKPLLTALNFLYRYVGNYGIAILILTLLVKLLLFPLSSASYKSMNKMKALQPKIEQLKQKYKEDKDALNREMMTLYQKEGVNPLSGCLPIFIQMPVYIALYYMISNAGELYGAEFLPFWLTDLSSKDPFYILPVALGILMFVQQKLTPQQMDNAQAKIMLYTMPLLFTWISLFMPSGLTLYWFANTVLGLVQQFYITKKYAV